MIKLYAVLLTWLTLALQTAVRKPRWRSEKGVETLEVLFWVVGILALAAVIAIAIKAYVDRNVAQIPSGPLPT